MVKYKYIGKTTWFYGKPLWEILGNLKNYGVGRLITRSVFGRYKEPSFFKIVKVEALAPDFKDNSLARKCVVWVEKIHRGLRYPQLIQLESSTYKPDYRLIHKEEEEFYFSQTKVLKKPVAKPPTHIPVPPLLKMILNEEKKLKGEPISEPMLMRAYTVSHVLANRVALSTLPEDDLKTPTIAGSELSKDASLYSNIEEFKSHFLKEK